MQTFIANTISRSQNRASEDNLRAEPSFMKGAESGCFHCGLPVRGAGFASREKSFCCQGCLTVFELLAENGLANFYELGGPAGGRIQRPPGEAEFKYLDDPAVFQRLVDFTNQEITRVTFRVPAVHCIACVWLLENLFRLKPGIGHSQVNFLRKEVAITFSNNVVMLSQVAALLASLGYEPDLKFSDLKRQPAQAVGRRLWLQLGVAGFAFGNIMLFSISGYLGLDNFTGPGLKKMFGFISLGLSLPVIFYSAADYWRSAWLSLRQRLLNIDVPIAAGIAALAAQSAYEVVSGRGEGYFDSLAGLLFFLLCGKLFQQKTYDRLAFDRDYKSFFPLAITRKRGSGEEIVSLAQLQTGDELVIRNGELIPADARLVEGTALIDYSFVTGEAEPVEKKPGDYLYAGGRQTGGAINVETLKPVSQSYLTSLWNQDAFLKNDGETLATLTNVYSQRFTKFVLAIALGAAVFWWFRDASVALKAFTSVLIVACPCALALAAPFALGTAQRVLGRKNVFLKNPRVIETLAKVDSVVFDKTGTLTAAGAGAVTWQGVSQISLTPGFSRVPGEHAGGETVSTVSRRARETDESVGNPSTNASTGLKPGANQRFCAPDDAALTDDEERRLYSMTRHSTHPLPVRIGEVIAHAHSPETVKSFRETPGCGMEGSVAGRDIWMGAAAWLESRGIVCRSQGDGAQTSFARKSGPPLVGSYVHVAMDGEYRGCFTLAGAVRPEMGEVLARLSASYELTLLSGDGEKERGRFWNLFGSDDAMHFSQSPLDKLTFIRRLQDSGKTVMMVGDGLNDAGALKQSDVGVAVVENISAFSPASDVILSADKVSRLDDVLKFSKRSVRVVRLSFLISSLYNIVGLSIAASGKLSPVVCAVLMPLSSVTVVAFACGVTAWTGRRQFDSGRRRHEESQTKKQTSVSLLTSAPAIIEAQP